MNGGARISKKMADTIRLLGVIIPIFVMCFSTLLQAQHGVNFVLPFLYIAWLSLCLVQYYDKVHSKRDHRTYIVAYHVFASLVLLASPSLTAPFLGFWLVLSLVTYLYYHSMGLIISLTNLVFVLLVHMALDPSASITDILYDLATVIAVITATSITAALLQGQEKTRDYLSHSREREERQRNRLMTIINNQSNAIISVSSDGTIVVYNAATLGILDTNSDIANKSINDVLKVRGTNKKPINVLNMLRASHMTTKRDDIIYPLKGDDYIRLELIYTPIRQTYSLNEHSEEIEGYVISMEDITKAKSLDEEKDSFISVVSHELRTPITVAEGAVSNAQLMYDHPDIPPDAIRQSIKMAHDQVVFLAGMVNDLSTLSRAQRGVMANPEVIPVKELAFNLLNKYTPDAKKQGIRLDLDLSSRLDNVYTSRLYLEELLQDLITNAIKYTKEGGVTLDFKQKDGDITFAIRDTGIGISRAEHRKVFEKFYRSEDYRTRETSGTGLGLYIAAQLAVKMHTRIDLVSRLNHGSTFSFVLPLYKVATQKTKS